MVSRGCRLASDLAAQPDRLALAQRFGSAWLSKKSALLALIAERQQPSNGHGPATRHLPDSARMTILRGLPDASREPGVEMIG
ncbi:hypothetical protein CKO42_03685 [Lamprobacter modestohalophilus]|uniref:Uncharacterized protein n=1 Tax=Lamprobacter modestohalophilus TaxID=1064514 RepID=A0A9X0W792_9GAMM|nr:hypothetical protein [Lamprobacter modestohalophilus]